MKPELLAFWNEWGNRRSAQGEQDGRTRSVLERNCSAGENFHIEKATALLLRKVNKYEEALRRIAERPHEQEALMKHRKESGQESLFADEELYGAYLEMAHIAWAALGWMPPLRPAHPARTEHEIERTEGL